MKIRRPKLFDCLHTRWIRHSFTKWNSLSLSKQRFVIVAIILTFAIGKLFTYIYCNVYLISSYHLHKLEPQLELVKGQQAKCCNNVCGVSVEPKQYEYLGKDKAFFHETSGALWLNFRQACVVESMAYRNPNLTVHVLMTGQQDLVVNTATMTTLIDNYPNVKISSINLGDYFFGTLLEKWYFCSEWNRGPFAIAHLSDALRFLTLSKYGGYYSDLDIIQLRPIASYRNFVGAEDDDKLGSSIIHVDYQHPIIELAVKEFASTYRWYEWAYNGPDLLTRILLKWCRIDQLSLLEHCDKEFRILPPQSFYPIHYRQWKSLFTTRPKKSKLDDPNVIGVHIWNSMSHGFKIRKNSNQLYVDIARSSCPRIFETFPDNF